MGDNKNNKNKTKYSGRNLGKEEEFKGFYNINKNNKNKIQYPTRNLGEEKSLQNKNNKNKIEYSGRNLGKEEEFKGIYKIKDNKKKIQQNKKNTKQRNMGGIVGKQKKIDADGSGTITAKDFKLLRDGNKFVARQYGGKIGK
jgi:hypothetical protein